MADAKQELVELLYSLGESSQFVASGSVTPVLPGLVLKGGDSIGAPVSAAGAKRLIAQANQAPYGRGEDTIVDTKVRRVWQLEPSQFKLRNPEWKKQIQAIVDAVREEFGIAQEVDAKLYKLLVYERGSFFAPHRDTEKTPGMFATLVVALPSRHAGGTLVVRHDGQTKRIDFAGEGAEFKVQYAAFYADCQHEIEPVAAGYRVCLVYNLAIARKKKQPSAPHSAQAVEQAKQLLEQLFTDRSNGLGKLVIPLEHQYTEAGFDPRKLKGADRSCADVLMRAAAALNYECSFALLTHWQSGDVDYDAYQPRGGYWGSRRYRWGGYGARDEERDDDDVEMGEVFDEKLSLNHWLDVEGRPGRFPEINLKESEILTQEGKEDWYIQQEVHEATGNEGVSMERWYRQAVIVLWPRQHTFAILAGEGQSSALPELERMATGRKKAAELEACRHFAGQIVAGWQARRRYPSAESKHTGQMLKLLEKIGSPELVRQFLREVLPRDFDGSEGAALFRLCQKLGWTTFADELCAFVAVQKPDDYIAELGQIASICRELCCQPPEPTKERLAVCTALAAELAQAIERWDGAPVDWRQKEEKRAKIVEDVFQTFAAVQAHERLDRFVEHVLADDQRYDLRQALAPAVQAIFKRPPDDRRARSAVERLRRHCVEALKAATAQPVEPPKDWAREANLTCKCEDCRALAKFLRDPTQREGRFPLRKDRRQHLHGEIEASQCDCTHVTERIGSPQTLVCTKTQGSYERRTRQYVHDEKLLAELEQLAPAARPAGRKRTAPRRTAKRS